MTVRSTWRSRYAPTTLALAGVFVVAFILQVVAGNGRLWEVDLQATRSLGAGVALTTGDHRWWRYFMAALLHGGLLHLGFNTYAMLLLGTAEERVLGGGWMLTTFTFAAVVGNVLSARWVPIHTIYLGASGGIFGILAAVTAIAWLAPELGRLSRKEMTEWLVTGLLLGFVMRANTLAHLGGAIAGAILGIGLVLVGKKVASVPSRLRRLQSAGWLAGALCVLLFVVAGLQVWTQFGVSH